MGNHITNIGCNSKGFPRMSFCPKQALLGDNLFFHHFVKLSFSKKTFYFHNNNNNNMTF
jgi:hypothetical protein